jgi:hypothetical protein
VENVRADAFGRVSRNDFRNQESAALAPSNIPCRARQGAAVQKTDGNPELVDRDPGPSEIAVGRRNEVRAVSGPDFRRYACLSPKSLVAIKEQLVSFFIAYPGDRTHRVLMRSISKWPKPAWLFPVPALLVLVACGSQRTPDFRSIRQLMNSVRDASFPELKGVDIGIRDLTSDYVFLEARFTMTSYFSRGRLEYMLYYNEEAVRRGVPPEGLRAIVAHELAHIDFFRNQSRMGLAGLIRLLSPSFNMRFERKADLRAIALGYGSGLQAYRAWLYRNVPPARMDEKKRDYFSPDEIAEILRLEKANPQFMGDLERCVPRNYAEIEALARTSRMKCAE